MFCIPQDLNQATLQRFSLNRFSKRFCSDNITWRALHVFLLFQKQVELNLERGLCNRLSELPQNLCDNPPTTTTFPLMHQPTSLFWTHPPLSHTTRSLRAVLALKSRAGFSSLPLSNAHPQWADVTVLELRRRVPSL